MGETGTTQTNSPPATAQASSDAVGSTSPETTPITFTKDQVDQEKQKAVRDALAEAGRKHKAEVETAVTKAREIQQATIQEHVERIAQLEADLEQLAGDDADKSEILKLKRELRSEKDTLKTERQTLAEQKEAHDKEWTERQAELAAARSENFAVVAWDVADQYDGGDAVKLRAICERAGNLTESFAREMAATLWVKKTDIKKPLVEGTPDRGGTAGGANTWESIRDAYSANPNDPAIKAAYMDARRKRGIS